MSAPETKPLAGKSALVTGGARRIGREIALTLARAGANVAITYRTSQVEAESTRAELASLGVQALSLPCDLRDEAGIVKSVQTAVAEFDGLDILVNNAGSFETLPLEAISLEAWDAMFAVNSRAPFLVAKAAYAALKQAGGRIINVGSLGGDHAWATHGHYCAAKAALHMLSRTMAKAWAPEISVNCVAPGMIVLDAGDGTLAAKTPMQQDGTAADVAAAVLFFATGPHFITGQVLAVDGGLGL